MKVLNFGSLNIDTVYKVPHIVSPGETLAASLVQQFAGGKGANQSVALAKAGADVYHAGTVGHDGLWLLEHLKNYGVNCDLIRKYDGPTGQAVIQVSKDGQNAIVLMGGGNLKMTEEQVDLALSFFQAQDYLVLQNEINLTPYIIEKANKIGMKICLNPAPYSDEIRSWPLDLLELLVVNEIEGRELAGTGEELKLVLDTLCSRFPGLNVLLTAGKDGAFFGQDAHRVFVPITDIPVVDTTAAGDTFFGYFLASRIRGIPVKQSMELAARASALTVSRPGAMESIPFAAELED